MCTARARPNPLVGTDSLLSGPLLKVTSGLEQSIVIGAVALYNECSQHMRSVEYSHKIRTNAV